MSAITIMFKDTDDSFYEEHGSKFIRFTTLPQLHDWELETALNADPVCKGLVDFHYDPTSGTGRFILPGPAHPFPRQAATRCGIRCQR